MKRQWMVSALLKSALPIFTVAAGSFCLASPAQGPASPLPVRSLEQLGWTVADFDGDNQPDVVISNAEGRYGYSLEFQLSAKGVGGSPILPSQPLSAFGLHLTPRDVDGDHDLDIVITVGFSRQPVAVWINDGHGRFEEGDLAAYPACISLEDFSLSPQNQPGPAQVFLGQSSRSWLGPGAGRGLVRPVCGAGLLPHRRPELLIYSPLPDQHSSRAPPALFSFLS
jgi:hypothetical protein